jgi:hypothetical protein
MAAPQRLSHFGRAFGSPAGPGLLHLSTPEMRLTLADAVEVRNGTDHTAAAPTAARLSTLLRESVVSSVISPPSR